MYAQFHYFISVSVMVCVSCVFVYKAGINEIAVISSPSYPYVCVSTYRGKTCTLGDLPSRGKHIMLKNPNIVDCSKHCECKHLFYF